MTEHDGSGEILPDQCHAISERAVRCRARAQHGERYCVHHATREQRRVTGFDPKIIYKPVDRATR